MQIQSGKLYENKAWKYLYPCLKSYGSTLKNYLNSLYKVAIGLGDKNIDIEDDNCLYILIDTNIHTPQVSLESYRENLSTFLDWLRFQPFYVTDYVFDGLETSEKHMLVIKIPESYHKAIHKFKKGRYSEMYSSKELGVLFPYVSLNNKELEIRINERTKETRSVLLKSKDYLPTFQKKLNKDFDTNLSLEDLKDHELDYPPLIEEEVFNLKKIKVI